jgi:dTDP-4-dehydrorhamnose 3,5-epimerase
MPWTLKRDLIYTASWRTGAMDVKDLSLQGLKKIRIKTFFDDRGFFRETFRNPLYAQAGIPTDFAQDNHSFSKQGTLRGMHFQRSPGQAKLVTVLEGEIFDVVVDIRPTSPTFGKWEGVTLRAEEGDQLYIPVGFAHGFCVLSETAHVCYKVSTIYTAAEEFTFRYDDPEVGIVWPISAPLLSERDRLSPLMREVIL